MLDKFHVYMTAFKEKRGVTVWLPQDYENEVEKRYPVLYMHDGQNVFNDDEAIGGTSLALEKYLDNHSLDVIVVAIDQNSEERFNEYSPWVSGDFCKKVLGDAYVENGGKGKEYVDFIVNELKPLIDCKYRTKPKHTAIAGISLGGLISTYAACMYPSIFKHVIAISSGFYRNQEEIEKLLKNRDLSKIESFYLDCGTNEGGSEYIQKAFLASNTAIFEIIKEKIPNATFEIIDGGKHHYLDFKQRAPQLFKFLQMKGTTF